MRTSSVKSDRHVVRPFAAFGSLFAVLGLLFCIATPFVEDLPNRWTFLLGGFGYSAFLAFFVTGIFLLPQPLQTCAHTALFIGAFIPGVIMLLAFHLSFPLSLFDGNTRPLLWALGTFLVVLFAFACYGWFHRLTVTPASRRTV